MNRTRIGITLAALLFLTGGTWWTVTALTPATPGLQVDALAPASRDDYKRDCSPGQGCVFGPAWTDDTTGTTWSRNGCDTRSDLLRRDLTNIVIESGTHGCTVSSGTLIDPYTGSQLDYTRATGGQVSGDHV